MRSTVFSAGNEGVLVISLTIVVSGRCGGFVFAKWNCIKSDVLWMSDDRIKGGIIITIINATFGNRRTSLSIMPVTAVRRKRDYYRGTLPTG